MKHLCSSLAILCFSFHLIAQELPPPILFIYDASGSMWGKTEDKTKNTYTALNLKGLETEAEVKDVLTIAAGKTIEKIITY